MRPEAVAALEPFLTGLYGNPTGTHGAARAAKAALEAAREDVAEALGARPSEIVFTGSGSEADNLAVKGAARAARSAGRGGAAPRVVTTRIEHKAVLAAVRRLAAEGFEVIEVPPTPSGVVDLDAFAAALSPTTVLASMMLVNNEVGTIQPFPTIAEMVRSRAPDAVLHTDAVQAVPWVEVATLAAGADLVAVSGHKFGGPKGVGALVVRNRVPLEPLVEGGGHEWELRAGTQNVGGIVSFAAALRATVAQRAVTNVRLGDLRERLAAGLVASIPDAHVNASDAPRTAGHLHLSVPGVEAEALLVALDGAGVYAAAGSSCSSGALEPSPVLLAMGMSDAAARSSLRLSLGATTTAADVDGALAVIPECVRSLRAATVA